MGVMNCPVCGRGRCGDGHIEVAHKKKREV